MSDKNGASKHLQQTVTKVTGIDHKEFDDLSEEERETLEVIRQMLALDILGYTNAQIERVLGKKKDSLYGLQGNYIALWTLAENDFIRRIRLHLNAVNESIAELISDGECEMLWRLRQVAKGGKRKIKVPGHPSLSLGTVDGDITAANIIASAQGFLKHSEIINQRVLQELGLEEAKERGYEAANDEYAQKVKEARASEKERKVVKAHKKTRAEDSARSYANATQDKSEKDLLPM